MKDEIVNPLLNDFFGIRIYQNLEIGQLTRLQRPPAFNRPKPDIDDLPIDYREISFALAALIQPMNMDRLVLI